MFELREASPVDQAVLVSKVGVSLPQVASNANLNCEDNGPSELHVH